jgi:hypothetical protein
MHRKIANIVNKAFSSMSSSISEETRVRCCLEYRAFYASFAGE